MHTKNGRYSVKSGYWVAKQLKDAMTSKPSTSANKPEMWRWLWNLKVRPKVKFFLWRCMQNSLPTRQSLLKRGVDVMPLCPRCGNSEETQEHILRDCDWSSFYWNASVLHIEMDSSTQSLSIQDWILDIISKKDKSYAGIFDSLLWMIWRARNLLIFQNISLDHSHFFHIALSNYYEFERLHFASIGQDRVADNKSFWSPPPPNYIKANIDASIDNLGRVGLGGLIRNDKREVIDIFAKRLESTPDILTAEALACYMIIMRAVEMRVTNLILETDNQELANLVTKKITPQNYLGKVIANILAQVQKFSSFTIQWCRRTANISAHEIARLAVSYPSCSEFHSSFMSDVIPFVAVTTDTTFT